MSSINGGTNAFTGSGLTKREELAKTAMLGYLSNPNHSDFATKDTNIAKWSVDMADALLEALAK